MSSKAPETCGCLTNPLRQTFADGDPHGCYCDCADRDREGCVHG